MSASFAWRYSVISMWTFPNCRFGFWTAPGLAWCEDLEDWHMMTFMVSNLRRQVQMLSFCPLAVRLIFLSIGRLFQSLLVIIIGWSVLAMTNVHANCAVLSSGKAQMFQTYWWWIHSLRMTRNLVWLYLSGRTSLNSRICMRSCALKMFCLFSVPWRKGGDTLIMAVAAFTDSLYCFPVPCYRPNMHHNLDHIENSILISIQVTSTSWLNTFEFFPNFLSKFCL